MGMADQRITNSFPWVRGHTIFLYNFSYPSHGNPNVVILIFSTQQHWFSLYVLYSPISQLCKNEGAQRLLSLHNLKINVATNTIVGLWCWVRRHNWQYLQFSPYFYGDIIANWRLQVLKNTAWIVQFSKLLRILQNDPSPSVLSQSCSHSLTSVLQ